MKTTVTLYEDPCSCGLAYQARVGDYIVSGPAGPDRESVSGEYDSSGDVAAAVATLTVAGYDVDDTRRPDGVVATFDVDVDAMGDVERILEAL